jgi:hypothetical protein
MRDCVAALSFSAEVSGAAPLAEHLATLLGQTSGQGYPACDFTLARIADESSKE